MKIYVLRIFKLELKLLKPVVRKEYLLKTQIKNSQIVENFFVGNLRYESYNVETKIKKRRLVENQNQSQPNLMLRIFKLELELLKLKSRKKYL